jgi:hypothetical protein
MYLFKEGATMSGSKAPTEYIQLAFMLERHFPGYVDAYYGPPELKTRATTGNAPSFAELEDHAAAFGQSIATDPDISSDRRTFLEEELGAMRTTIQILEGNVPNIVDEVRLLYGVTPEWIDERAFDMAHNALNEILPGSKPLSERVQDFRERSHIPVEAAMPIIHQLVGEFRSRTQRLFGLSLEERCEFSTVSDKPWRAYN